MEDKARKTGIDVIGDVSWGTHICQLYRTKQDLIDILVPYFKAGLENNEFCMWVTSESLDGKKAEEVMGKAMPNFAQYLERAQIEIIPYDEWYLKDGAFNRQRVLGAWIDKLNQALDKGYDGMRVTGNAAWLEKRDWRKFTDYEEEINNVINKHRVIAIYTCPLDRCGAGEVMDVVCNHQFALIRRGGEWVTIQSSGHKQVEHELGERMKELACVYGVTNIAERQGITLDELYQEVANLLPQGWQYPEITCAKITINSKEFKTANYSKTKWKQSSDIMVCGVKTGVVEIGYLEERPELDEGPFLKEERLLIDSTAKRLGDITERKKAEGRIKNEKEFTSSLLKGLADGFAIVDQTGKQILVNDELCKMTGYSKKEMLAQKPPFEYWAEEGLEDINDAFGKTLKGIEGEYELTFKRKDGERFIALVNPRKTVDSDGNIIFFATIKDITEQKRAGESQETTSRATSGGNMMLPQGKFNNSGLGDLSDREAIVLLLGLCLPPGECKKLAKECMKQFKNLRGFLSASPQELEQVGVPPQDISYIKLVHEIPAKVLKEKLIDKPVYRSPGDVIDYLNYSMRDLKNELFKVIYLNNRNQIIDTADLFEGTVESTPIRPREIVETAINCNATGLIFAHNHPSGDPTSSKSDRQLTRDLVFMGMVLQIRVLDHIIIGVNTHFSFTDEGLIKKYEDNFLNLRIRSMFDSGADYSVDTRRVPTLRNNR